MTTTESSSKEEFDNQLKTLSAIKHCFLHAACTNTAHYIVFSLLYINTLYSKVCIKNIKKCIFLSSKDALNLHL